MKNETLTISYAAKADYYNEMIFYTLDNVYYFELR